MRWIAVLALAVLAACGSDDVTNRAAPTTTSAAGPATAPSWFGVAPVVAPVPCTPEATQSRDESTCYQLGGAVIDAAGVADARAIEGERPCEIPPGESMCIAAGPSASAPSRSTWSVEFSVTDDALRSFNALAEMCFQRSATCPTGQVAIIIDGEVVSAPVIQVPEYDGAGFAIGVGPDEAAARDIAERLSA